MTFSPKTTRLLVVPSAFQVTTGQFSEKRCCCITRVILFPSSWWWGCSPHFPAPRVMSDIFSFSIILHPTSAISFCNCRFAGATYSPPSQWLTAFVGCRLLWFWSTWILALRLRWEQQPHWSHLCVTPPAPSTWIVCVSHPLLCLWPRQLKCHSWPRARQGSVGNLQPHRARGMEQGCIVNSPTMKGTVEKLWKKNHNLPPVLDTEWQGNAEWWWHQHQK